MKGHFFRCFPLPWMAGLCFPILMTAPAGTCADTSRAAFDTLEAGLHYSAVVNETAYNDYWEQGEGLEAWVLTPFYSGDIKLGARYLFNRGKDPTAPDYNSLYIYLGWSYPLAVSNRVTVHPGLALGSNIMSFDTEEGAGIQNETEAAAELFARLGIRTYGPWQINLTVGWQKMFTYHPIEQVFFTAGVSRYFGMPDWLRGFLE